ncbi:MAG: hydrogenase 3 maturation endopeptidase HyCI [Spirochaetota bacterium]
MPYRNQKKKYSSIIEYFNRLAGKKVVILGVGNRLRGDDGAAPCLIDNIQGKVEALCINAESSPENYLGKIIKTAPDAVVIVDAIHLGREPGEMEVLDPSELERGGISTHHLSLKMLVEFLGSEIETEIRVLGVQPARIHMGDEMSSSVKKSLKALQEIITSTL